MATTKKASSILEAKEKKVTDKSEVVKLKKQLELSEAKNKKEIDELKQLILQNNQSLNTNTNVKKEVEGLADVLDELKARGNKKDSSKDFEKTREIYRQADEILNKKNSLQEEYELKRSEKHFAFAKEFKATHDNFKSRLASEKVHPELSRFIYNHDNSNYAPSLTVQGGVTGVKYNFEKSKVNYIYNVDLESVEAKVSGTSAINPIMKSLSTYNDHNKAVKYKSFNADNISDFDEGAVNLNDTKNAQGVLNEYFNDKGKGDK